MMVAMTADATQHAWLVLIGLLPLFLTIRVDAPQLALRMGATWGATVFAVLSLSSHPLRLDPLTSLILLTLAPALYAYGGAHLTRLIGFSPFVLGVAWMLVELALAPMGHRHGLLAATQGDGVLMQSMGRTLGYVLVAFVIAYASALLLTSLAGVCGSGSAARGWHSSCAPIVRLSSPILPDLKIFAICFCRPRAPPASIQRTTRAGY
jgi:apolipoprotein N-acyltransferase